MSGGYSQTSGMMHSGLGPFKIDQGAMLGGHGALVYTPPWPPAAEVTPAPRSPRRGRP
jgi:hypothetical protein